MGRSSRRAGKIKGGRRPLTVHLSPQEGDIIKRKAAESGLSESAYARRILLRELIGADFSEPEPSSSPPPVE